MSIFPSFSSTGNRVSYCTQTNKTGGRCSAEPPPAPSERRSHSHARDRKSPHPPGAGRRAVPQEKHGGYRLRQAQREEARGGCRGSGGSGGGVSAPAGCRRRREHGVPSGRHDPQLHGSAAHRQRHRHRGERAERPGLLHPVLRRPGGPGGGGGLRGGGSAHGQAGRRGDPGPDREPGGRPERIQQRLLRRHCRRGAQL